MKKQSGIDQAIKIEKVTPPFGTREPYLKDCIGPIVLDSCSRNIRFEGKGINRFHLGDQTT